MSKDFIDLIYYMQDKSVALASIKEKYSHVLSFDGDVPHGVEGFPYVGVGAPYVDMYICRIPAPVFESLLLDLPEGFEILAAGYPDDDIETMLANNVQSFADDVGVRIAPTDAAHAKYRELYPASIELEGETVLRGNFAYLGPA